MIISSNHRDLKGDFSLNHAKIYSLEITNEIKERSVLIGHEHSITLIGLSETYYYHKNNQNDKFLILITGDIYGNLNLWKVYNSTIEKYCYLSNLADASFSSLQF